jgi:hypothetical protein
VGAHVLQAAFVEDGDPVRGEGGVEPVGDDERRATARQTLDRGPN